MEIAIALKHDRTQIVTGRESNNQIELKAMAEVEAIIPQVIDDDRAAVEDFFKRLAAYLKIKKGSGLRISIPSSMTVMNCRYFENIPENNYLRQELDRMAISTLGIKNPELYNIDKAKIVKDRKTMWLTSVAVKTKYISMLRDAMVMSGFRPVAIENESVAAMRYEGFSELCGYLESDNETALALTASHQKIGMFTIIKRHLDAADKYTGLLQAFEIFDSVARSTFGQNNYTPCRIVTSAANYHEFADAVGQTQYASRFAKLPVSEAVKKTNINEEEIVKYAAPIGLLLGSYYQRRGKREAIRGGKSFR